MIIRLTRYLDHDQSTRPVLVNPAHIMTVMEKARKMPPLDRDPEGEWRDATHSLIRFSTAQEHEWIEVTEGLGTIYDMANSTATAIDGIAEGIQSLRYSG